LINCKLFQIAIPSLFVTLLIILVNAYHPQAGAQGTNIANASENVNQTSPTIGSKSKLNIVNSTGLNQTDGNLMGIRPLGPTLCRTGPCGPCPNDPTALCPSPHGPEGVR
jgi:hypothetical protein